MELVPAAMGSLLSNLGELLKQACNLQKGVEKDVRLLESELESMHAALLKVAEVPLDQLDEQVKLWARDVRELSYDMEDIVDTFLVRVGDGREATANPDSLRRLMEKMGNLFLQGKAHHQIANAIKGISERSQEVADRRKRLKVDDVVTATTPIDPRLRALYAEATELIGIYGKKDEELIKMLSEGDDVSQKKLKIVSVVGLGGLGKTTLAKAVKDKIEGDFDFSAFVPVGRNPDMKKVFGELLCDLDEEKYTKEVDLMVLDEGQMIDEVREFLENKRYLIIIDDVWDEETWKRIRCAFSNGNSLGSRLITTTRIVSVSKVCCSSSDDFVYEMNPLSDDDSQRLFYQRIFSDRNSCPLELEQVSRDILKKCGGVPLAIITIASLLASNKQIKAEDQWSAVLNSIGRGLTKYSSVEMQRILSFCYYDLPSHLKTCLLYLSIFPKDYSIGRDDVIWRWIAEGFVQCEKPQTSLFELGESYFNELINRSMIQPEYDANYLVHGRVISFCIHDMVLDLIRSLSSDENFVTVLDSIERSTNNLQSKVRRLSLQNTSSKVDQSTALVSVSHLRSIIVYPPAINLMRPLSSFDVLRVLELRRCDHEKVSHINFRDVGDLFHLRYLELRDVGIHELPKEIGNLQFLLVLDVRENPHLEEMPSTIVKLRRLMCLLCDEDLEGLPDGMGNLTSMQELGLISTNKSTNIVKELRNLTRLRELRIKLHGGCLELEEFFVESVCNLHNIQSLELSGSFESLDLLGERWVPPQHLCRFYSWEVGKFSTLPAWLKRNNPSLLSDLSVLFINVKELRQEDLQILGRLPALRSLAISSTRQTQMLLLVSANGFHCVMFFELYCGPFGQIMFQQGALPRAEIVQFSFGVRMAKDYGSGDFDFGLGNLRSLREVQVTVYRDGAMVGEAKQAEAMLRHAIHVHANHPTIDIKFKPDLPEHEEQYGVGSYDEDEYPGYLSNMGDEGSKSFFRHRFSSLRLQKVVSGLTPRQREYVISNGFEGLLSIAKFKVPSNLVQWIMGNMSPVFCEFRYCGKVIVFTKAMIQKVLGIPSGEKPLKLSGKVKDIIELRDMYRIGDRSPIVKAIEVLKGSEDEDTFMRSFMLVSLASVLCPNTGNMVCLDYLFSLVDISEIKEYDWAGEVLNVLMREVDRYQKLTSEQQYSVFQIGGCLPLLVIAYMDHLDLPRRDLHNHAINYALPRICHISDEDFEYVEKVDRNRLNLNSITFGYCPFRDLSCTPYNEATIQENVVVADSVSLEEWLCQSQSNSQSSQVPQNIQEIVDKHDNLWAEDLKSVVATLRATHANRTMAMIAEVRAAIDPNTVGQSSGTHVQASGSVIVKDKDRFDSTMQLGRQATEDREGSGD